MKRILVDLSNLKENNQNAILGIKYFLSKNKEDELTVIANSNDTVTIHNNKRIIIAQTDESENFVVDDEFKNLKERSHQILLTLLKKEKFNSFVTFSSLEELQPYIDKYFVKVTSPLLICSYANYKTHKCTIIGDIGYNFKPKSSDICSYVRSLKEYATNIYKFKTTKFKVVKSSIINIEDFKNDSDYEGELDCKDLYIASTDIVISDAYTCSTMMKSIEGAIDIYNSFIKDEVKRNVGLRYFVYPMFRGVFANFQMNIDKKFVSGGVTLLGYDKKVVFVTKDTIAMGVKAAIDNCAKF